MNVEIKRGQAISFRVPSDTPDHLLKQLQRLKETERRNFSSTIAEFVLQGVNQSFKKEQETITIPLPKKLSKSQRDWLKHEHSEALLGSIVYQLLTDPGRATALLASLNSNALDIDEALYLQEETSLDTTKAEEHKEAVEESAVSAALERSNDDINDFNWQDIEHNTPLENEEEERDNDLDSLLGDFLSKMNK
ncbi:hypothetical protein GCM10011391_37580 [Pullulanibacillus camelliae]|uniref:Uncharacterized protein n=1 Tax=Pullulanibacillus camelliae TaxID=1707096 RepID=A0A8J2YNC1_9BACL|nr:hypothetical protein [Pullulanibacillus camelliae]GGE55086.1 hypothetical protein GCM10011391_37580 [Pullulanibacillus camelliae]